MDIYCVICDENVIRYCPSLELLRRLYYSMLELQHSRLDCMLLVQTVKSIEVANAPVKSRFRRSAAKVCFFVFMQWRKIIGFY